MNTLSARRISVSCLIAWLALSRLAAQTPPLQPLPAQSLSSVPLSGASSTATTATEVTIRWTLQAQSPAPPAPGDQTGNQFDLVASRSVPPLFVRERDPQLAVGEIVVIAADANGQPVGWQHVRDPRIVRAESPGADGVLTGQTFYRPVAEMVVSVPDDVGATQLRFYEPQWTGQTFVLNPLGTVALNPR
jgi:hypothetical protein